MTALDYNERFFASLSNSGSGEVTPDTVFHYRQRGRVVWATYDGGEILCGTLVAKVLDDGALEMRYSHVNRAGDLMTGRCRSTPEMLPDGRLRLHESWQWTCGDCSAGHSIVEEIKR
ncbi:MAG: hypothetical protein WCD76_22235 [Pyrinomonadaceae bacterium]